MYNMKSSSEKNVEKTGKRSGSGSESAKAILKKDGRYEEFDEKKLRESISGLQVDLDKAIAFVMKTNPLSSADIRDTMALFLLDAGKIDEAKNYIRYKYNPEDTEKRILLKTNTLDEVAQSMNMSQLRVLAYRYLVKEKGSMETPFDLFSRVAVTLAIPEFIYRHLRTESAEPFADALEPTGEFNIGKHLFNKYHLKIIHQVWTRLNERGRISKPLDEILQSLSDDAVVSEKIEQYYSTMVKCEFLPNSPCLMNAGQKLGQFSACFVIHMDDNIISIMDGAKTVARIFQSGGGVGINYSDLRHRGAPVESTAGTASGPVVFMGVIDAVTDAIRQGGRRRGANMGILEIWHPDIEEFIGAKLKPGKLTNFNVSVGIWDDFWDNLFGDKIYKLRTSRYGDEVKEISARRLFDYIATSAWNSADPGLIFLDTVNKHNVLIPARNGPIRATNPCWGGDVRVLTKEGPKEFRELALGNSTVEVLTREDNGDLTYRTMRNPGLTASETDVMCVVLQDSKGGCSAKICTPNHKVYTSGLNGATAVEVKDLQPGERIQSIYEEEDKYIQTIGPEMPKIRIKTIEPTDTGQPSAVEIPLAGKAEAKGGLFKGIKSSNEKNNAVIKGGYLGAAGELIEVDGSQKNSGKSKWKGLFSKKNHTVLAVLHAGKADVYNGVVDGTHRYFVEAGDGHYILSGNCGEQALYPGESCNLGSINVAKFVRDGDLDWEELRKTIAVTTRMLDGVMEANKYPTEEVDVASRETKRIGLGVMGVSDALYMLGIPYNSRAGMDFHGRLAEFITYHSMLESTNMSEERGPFPLFEKSSYVSGMLPVSGATDGGPSRLDWDGLRQRIKEVGIRHVLTTTVAPTGTISMIAGCAGGIEPVFALAYEKKVTIGSFMFVNDQFKEKMGGMLGNEATADIADTITENGGSCQTIDAVPDDVKKIFVTSMDIHWADHILAQAEWQRWISNSISKTINMPKSSTVEDVKAAYVLAYSLGLHGITIYRDESKETQVLNVDGHEHPPPKPSDAARDVVAKLTNPYVRSLMSAAGL